MTAQNFTAVVTAMKSSKVSQANKVKKLTALMLKVEDIETVPQDIREYVIETLGGISVEKSTDGKLYEVDTVKKTCKKIFKDLKQIDLDDISETMDMSIYCRLLKDKFPGEGAKMQKGKLYFRGYRISCDVENGFMIEDSTKRYAVVEHNMEGIPTPKELGEWFTKKQVVHTPEELTQAEKVGKMILENRKAEREEKLATASTPEELDLEKELVRAKGIANRILEGKKESIEPEEFSKMIPNKKWRRAVNKLVKDWKAKSIRYKKFLQLVVEVADDLLTREEQNHRTEFVGTILPEFNEIGILKGDKIEVDGKFVDAVPFMLNYMLHYEPKAMQQIMRFAEGEVTTLQLLKEPYHQDHKIEFNSKLLKNTAENAQVLSALCASIELVAPQDLLYVSDLKVGDKILLNVDGEWKVKQVMDTSEGVVINKGVGLLKLDKWVRYEK